MSDETYNVVIEYTEAAGGWAGNRYWTSLKNESDLEAWQSDLGDGQKVIAHGITGKQAENMTADVPVECLVAAAFEECTIDGVVEPMMLKMQLANTAFAAGDAASRKGIPSKLASMQYGLAVINHINTKIADIGERHRILEGINSDSF
jgi:hypothetical protein